MINRPLLSVFVIAAAGSAHTALAQSQQTPPSQPRERDRERVAASVSGVASDYRSARWLTGRDVANQSGENVGEVSDLIIDRGSGVVHSVALKSGSVLGMGGRTVAVPYDRFQWDSARGRLVLTGASEDVKGFPSFTKDEWREDNKRADRPSDSNRPAAVSDTVPGNNPDASRAGNANAVEPRRNGMNDGAEVGRRARDTQPGTMREYLDRDTAGQYAENYGAQWDNAARQRVEGEIRRVDRQYSPRFGDTVIVEVAAQDGGVRKVALGPSWYLSGGEAPLNRGDKISVEYVPINIATSARINGREVSLRDQAGAGAWAGKSFESGGRSYPAPFYRNALLSQIVDARLDCRGVECGRVDDVILDANTGVVAFVSIDPNQNFLGIADTKRLAPWQVCSMALDGTVRVDTSKDMVLASMKTPSDITSLNTSQDVTTIYGAYKIEPRDMNSLRRWDREDTRSWDGARNPGAAYPGNPSQERREAAPPANERRDNRRETRPQ